MKQDKMIKLVIKYETCYTNIFAEKHLKSNCPFTEISFILTLCFSTTNVIIKRAFKFTEWFCQFPVREMNWYLSLEIKQNKMIK